ncbi:MAG TPA: hemerythrin domain-containing protein [Sporichthya sp.]|nr:hemerythrin domain-containing protein [Sporichthya sp.]
MDPACRAADELIDITDLILSEHDAFRRGFAALDKILGPDVDPGSRRRRLAEVWTPLAAHLDRHAAAEEAVVFPALLRHGTNAEHETLDAVGDHNDIRNAVRDAGRYPAGSAQWWAAVERARAANTHHMAEEEDEALADLRRNTTREQRSELGRQFRAAMARVGNLPAADNTDPLEFLARHRQRSGGGASRSGDDLGTVAGNRGGNRLQ